ncbi:MAG TPA: (4Fe-4S)-binding protein [Mucilaginibacter sp.]|nr:(4Fe-4S)-binding protein [Mucilaginibacter sp.]
MEDIIKKYDNGEVTVIWQPHLCAHSGNCVRGLPSVFDNKVKPWININGAGTESIIGQVRQCPSGALSFVMNEKQ